MKILYVGARNGTSQQRADALVRLGHAIVHVDPYCDLPRRWATWLNRQGGAGLDTLVARSLSKQIPHGVFDVAHVDSGDVIGPKAFGIFQDRVRVVSNLNVDNPYTDPPPERNRWAIFRRTVSKYDLCVTIRRPGIESMMRVLGVREPLTVWQSADEVMHAPFETLDGKWASEVCFVGTWMPGREDFLSELIGNGIDLTIYGPRWDKAHNYDQLKPHIRGKYLEGRDYAAAIAGAKIGLVLLNDRNFDLHTQRSVEIPAIGTAICALRTPFHEKLYKENTEALFFDSAKDCAEKCKDLLSNSRRLKTLSQSGHARAIRNGNFNERTMSKIVETVTKGGR